MSPKVLSSKLTVSPQIRAADLKALADAGYELVISNRPDGEDPDQPDAATMAREAAALGVRFAHIPVVSGRIGDGDVADFVEAMEGAAGRVHAFCRSGTRSATLWALSQAGQQPTDAILTITSHAGYDLASLRPRLEKHDLTPARPGMDQSRSTTARHDILIVGGGSAGIAVAASLRSRNRALDIAIVEPREEHYYQPGWTMVGGGIFTTTSTCRSEASVIPRGVRWIKASVRRFRPDDHEVELEDGQSIGYQILVVAPGIMLDWDGIDGLAGSLGRNGVTSNYSYETAPYTWELVQSLRDGVALFTQPPMPIKCAGAPQKAMYLSCDHWKRAGRLSDIDVAFHNAGPALFGVKDYVPPLMDYIRDYGIDLQLESRLVAVDGPGKQATFATRAGEVTHAFDMLHVCPPQKPPLVIRDSPLANAAGYVEVDEATLRHTRHANIFGLGDAASTSNAKTAAAVRRQAPVVAVNIFDTLAGREPSAGYDGYGSCPLTVERGKIVLAEFGYGGKLLPTFPTWLIDGTRPQRLSWWLKSQVLPFIYWNAMLKGHEWLASPSSLAAVKAVA